MKEITIILDSFLTREIITFEDLFRSVNGTLPMPDNYRGLQWAKIYYMNEFFAMDRHPNSGYVTSFIPCGSLHIGFFSEEASISIEPPNETFTLVCFTASAAWRDNLLLTVRAFRNSIQVNYCDIILVFGRPQLISLQWTNIDKVTFKPSGGIPHPGQCGCTGIHVALTQLVVNNLPERKNNL